MADISEFGKSGQGIHGLLTVLDAEDAFQPHDTTCPGSFLDLVDVTAVRGLPVAEGCSGGQSGPSTHDALTTGQLISGQLDPLVLK